jgi:flagellar biosynthesis/type III secretory pathway protein FliH
MSSTAKIHLDKPVTSVTILDDYNGECPANSCSIGTTTANGGISSDEGLSSPIDTQQAKAIAALEEQKAELAKTHQALRVIADKLNQFYTDVLAGHKDEIARLSVDIANKILMRKIEKGDYKIEAIVKEVLKSAPVHQDIVVHLNPDDLVHCQKLQKDDPNSSFAKIKFVADPGIGRAECLVKTPKGIVKSLIDEHMERIIEALTKVK